MLQKFDSENRVLSIRSGWGLTCRCCRRNRQWNVWRAFSCRCAPFGSLVKITNHLMIKHINGVIQHVLTISDQWTTRLSSFTYLAFNVTGEEWSSYSLGLSLSGLTAISSRHLAGNQPTCPRQMPSQYPPSPTLRTTRDTRQLKQGNTHHSYGQCCQIGRFECDC